MPGSARLKPRWPSRPWLPPCWCAARVSRQCPCRCDASTPRVRPHGWRPAATVRPRVRPRAWPHRAPRWMCTGTAITSSPRSAVDRRCCPEWSSSAKLFRRLSREDTGAATVLAAALVAALVAIALGGVWVGGAAVARHRAQAAADLAALAAAGRLPLGPDAACAQARTIAAAMGAAVSGCDIQNLDVVVAVTVRPGGRIPGEARAAARAGPPGRA